MKQKVGKVIKYLFLFISFVILFLSIYIKINFNDVSFEQLIYSTFTSEGTSSDVIIKGAIFVLIGAIVTLVVINILKLLIKKYLVKYKKNIQAHITFKYKTKKIKFDLFKKTTFREIALSTLIIIGIIFVSLRLIRADEFIKSQFSKTEIFDEYYIDSRDVNIEFPENKKNLIYIYVESLEMTAASLENGGVLEKSYIPNLEALALSEDNINFSNTEKLGGALTLSGTSWTAASMISQTSGIPLKVSIDANSYQNYGESFPGIYNLGDILKDNGYSNYLLIGSKAEFGGRKDYFSYHGNYNIYDYHYAVDNKWIDKDYYVWWGYEDKKLYEFAKNTLIDISSKEEPFNFTMLTADTHFTDGYLDSSCEIVFDKQYPNVFYCADKMLNEFLNWLKEQDFYDNTTIIITGDHLTMQQDFYAGKDNNYDRNVYNVFINSEVQPINSKNRSFSVLDMFPTTLAAIGVKVDSDRLGLGTNLFSDKPTLIEELGYEYLENEIKKKSFFYDNYLLGNTYYEMQKKSNIILPG